MPLIELVRPDGTIVPLSDYDLIRPLALLSASLHDVGRLDERTNASVTLDETLDVGGSKSASISVPDSEVWVVTKFAVTGTAQPANGRGAYNIKISGKSPEAYFKDNRTIPNDATEEHDLTTSDHLGAPMVIVGPATITLEATVTAKYASGESQTVTLSLRGRKAYQYLWQGINLETGVIK
ncbi:hypothetical protein J7L60_01915 [Candidatus Bathyarchaeota archaeon]|nr:hypothetical protein [Candidatus Bathyarchaeota archaeon]